MSEEVIGIVLTDGVQLWLSRPAAEALSRQIHERLWPVDPWIELEALWRSEKRVEAVKRHRHIFGSTLKVALETLRERFGR